MVAPNPAQQPSASHDERKSPSQRKIDANRANARKSTGPRTRAGKAAASRNAYEHGLYADIAGGVFYLPPGEDAQEFRWFQRGFVRSLRPLGFAQVQIALQAARVTWKLRARLPRAEEALWLDALAGRRETVAASVEYQELFPRGPDGSPPPIPLDGDVDLSPAAARARLAEHARVAAVGEEVAAGVKDEWLAGYVLADSCAHAGAPPRGEGRLDPDFEASERGGLGGTSPGVALGRIERLEAHLRRELQSLLRALLALQKAHGMGDEEEADNGGGESGPPTEATTPPAADAAPGAETPPPRPTPPPAAPGRHTAPQGATIPNAPARNEPTDKSPDATAEAAAPLKTGAGAPDGCPRDPRRGT